jgi:hypothetical protein
MKLRNSVVCALSKIPQFQICLDSPKILIEESVAGLLWRRRVKKGLPRFFSSMLKDVLGTNAFLAVRQVKN